MSPLPTTLSAGSSWALAHPLRPELIIALVLICSLVVWWSYRRATLTRTWLRGVLTALRVLVLLLVGVAILQPMLRKHARDHSTSTVVLGIDVSGSMAFADGTHSRLARTQAQLVGADGIIARIQATGAQVRVFAFGEQCRELPPAAVPDLVAGDEETDLTGAIQTMSSAVRGGPGTALVLFTDAADTTEKSPTAAARRVAAAGMTVSVVALGGANHLPDVSIVSVFAPPSVEVGASTELEVEVGRSQYVGPVVVKLFHEDTFLTQCTIPAGTEAITHCALDLVPSKAGPLDLRVEAEPVEGEQALANNVRSLRLDAQERRLDVLFAEGSPRHEFAFIRRTMADDRHFRLVTLLRLGHQRYADSADDDGSVLSTGFPTTAEALGQFSAIILSDIEAHEFTASQLQLIHDFVTVRGGGLLMLGGTNAFNLGGYASTPIAELLPVELDPDDVSPTFDDRIFTLELTPAGLEHEILRQGRTSEATEAQWRLMPPLKGLNVLLKAKPGATVLAVRSTPAPASVVLAVQDVGSGRVAAFASANSWRWKMLRTVDDDSFRRFWSQMIRWLAVGNKQLLTVEVNHQINSVGQSVSITARVMDATHRPSNAAAVSATITDPTGHVDHLTLPWILSEEGVYEAQQPLAFAGNYQISVQATIPSGAPVTGQISVLAVKASHELAHPDLDLVAARALAGAGGGEISEVGDGRQVIDSVLSHLKTARPTVTVITQRELGDSPLLLLLTCALLLGEWGLRRTNGLS